MSFTTHSDNLRDTMRELLGDLRSGDPDDLAIACAVTCRAAGVKATILLLMREGHMHAVEVRDKDTKRVIASFPCAPIAVPPAYGTMLNAVVDMKGKKR